VSSVLVTGATGFIGERVLANLGQRDAEIHVASRKNGANAANIHWHRLDLADSAGVDALLERVRPERLVHLAWYVEHGRFWHAPENVDWVQRSLHLLRAFARAGGKRALITGTCAEYDWSAAARPLNESTSPIAPATLYGVAKDALRRLASAYANQADVDIAWARLFFLYGPREPPGRLVASVARALLRGEPAETSSGIHERDFLHVDDVAAALVALLDSSVSGPVNIASGRGVKLADVVDRIARETGRPELVRRGVLADRAEEPLTLVGDVSRLRDEVGFRPAIDIEAGIAASIECWREELSIQDGRG
jgi:nucleoside-diphosphate-sugar epimerase